MSILNAPGTASPVSHSGWENSISPSSWGNKGNGLPSKKVKKFEKFQNKMGLKGCKCSSWKVPGTESPVSHSGWENSISFCQREIRRTITRRSLCAATAGKWQPTQQLPSVRPLPFSPVALNPKLAGNRAIVIRETTSGGREGCCGGGGDAESFGSSPSHFLSHFGEKGRNGCLSTRSNLSSG